MTVIKFSADWCPPCQLLKPKWKEIKAKHKDMEFMEVDVDKFPHIASQHGVRSLPTILVIDNGDVLMGYTGDKDCLKYLEGLK